jgi:methylthioribose-1-phosphate isomerase
MSFDILRLQDDACYLIDQRAIPQTIQEVAIRTAPEMVHAIKDMIVRGAPAIGIAAAYGVVLSLRSIIKDGLEGDCVQARLQRDMDALRATRPTAVNLMWALDRMQTLYTKELHAEKSLDALLSTLEAEARLIHEEDIAANKAMGKHGASLFPENARIQTHCNAGALATGGHGTALGVIREAFAQGKCSMVYADETRPRLQGAKLTAWELHQDGIPVTVVTDGMSGHMMQHNMVDVVITGADRVVANGDAANKIGTYNLALVAKAHNVPFYIAIPSSTVDPTLATGAEIPIEERDASEITHINGVAITPEGVPVFNPGFDVTPASLITGIITEKGVFHPPYHFESSFNDEVVPTTV